MIPLPSSAGLLQNQWRRKYYENSDGKKDVLELETTNISTPKNRIRLVFTKLQKIQKVFEKNCCLLSQKQSELRKNPSSSQSLKSLNLVIKSAFRKLYVLCDNINDVCSIAKVKLVTYNALGIQENEGPLKLEDLRFSFQGRSDFTIHHLKKFKKSLEPNEISTLWENTSSEWEKSHNYKYSKRSCCIPKDNKNDPNTPFIQSILQHISGPSLYSVFNDQNKDTTQSIDENLAKSRKISDSISPTHQQYQTLFLPPSLLNPVPNQISIPITDSPSLFNLLGPELNYVPITPLCLDDLPLDGYPVLHTPKLFLNDN